MKNIFQRLEVHVTHFILWRHVIKWRLKCFVDFFVSIDFDEYHDNSVVKVSIMSTADHEFESACSLCSYMHFHPLWYLPFYSYIKRFRPVLNSPNLKFACWRQGQRSEIERGVYCHIYIMCFPIPTTPLFFNISLVLKCCWKQTI